MSDPSPPRPHHDPDGVRLSADPRTRRARRWAVAGGVLTAGVAAALLLRQAAAPPPAPAAPAVVAAGAPRPAAARPVKVLPAPRSAAAPNAGAAAPGDTTPPPRAAAAAADARAADEAAQEEERMLTDLMRDVVEGLRAHGGREGIGVFPPKGTNPPKPGLIVPKDFPLPEGYVRYHQVTDDGRRLDPILMFSPDYDFVDAEGAPLVLPESGIVPPELAPPGLPIRILEIPDDPGAGTR